MQREREDYLRSQADSLAMQMATISYQKNERWIRVLETSRAVVTLQSLLIQHLGDTKSPESQKTSQIIHRHFTVGYHPALEHFIQSKPTFYILFCDIIILTKINREVFS